MILGDESNDQVLTAMNYMRSCPSPKSLFPETVRKPLRDLVSGVCPRTASAKRISALEFRVSNLQSKVILFLTEFFIPSGFKLGTPSFHI